MSERIYEHIQIVLKEVKMLSYYAGLKKDKETQKVVEEIREKLLDLLKKI